MLWVFSMASRLGMLVCDVLTFHMMHVGGQGYWSLLVLLTQFSGFSVSSFGATTCVDVGVKQ